MKTQTLRKKLILNRQTISNLNDRQQNDIRGGVIALQATGDCKSHCGSEIFCSCATDGNYKTCCGSEIDCSC